MTLLTLGARILSPEGKHVPPFPKNLQCCLKHRLEMMVFKSRSQQINPYSFRLEVQLDFF